MSDHEVKFCPSRYCIWPRLLFCEDMEGNMCPALDELSASKTSECCGIVSGAAIRGMLLHHVGNELKRPVVILQKPLEKGDGCKLSCEKRQDIAAMLRQESTAFYEHKDSACVGLRDENHGCEYCFHQDSAARDWVLDNIEKHEDKDRITGEISIDFHCENIQLEGDLVGQVRVIDGVKMLVYTCLRSGYSEIAALVKCYDVKGVLIAGQTVLNSSDRRKIEEKFTEQIKEEYDATFEEKFPENKHDWVERAVNKRIKKHEPEGGEEAYLKLISKSVNDFVKDLKTCYDRRVDIRIMQVIARAEQNLDNSSKESKASGVSAESKKEPSALVTANYNNVVEKLKETLAERCRTESGTTEPGTQDYLGLCLQSKNIQVQSVPFDPLDGIIREVLACNGRLCGPDEKGLYQCKVVDGTDKDGIFKAESIVEVTGIEVPKSWNAIEFEIQKKKQEDIERIFEGVLKRFKLIRENLRAEYHQGRYEIFTRSMRHELGQLHGGNKLSLSLPKYLYETYSKQSLSRRRVGYLLRDFDSYLNASVMRVRSTAYMSALFPEPDKAPFFPYDEVLFRWKQIYLRRARQMQIDFRLFEPQGGRSDIQRPKLNADRDQFEQIAYNLTNNAFKYALDGTVVNVDCRLDPSNMHRYCFRVSNYSFTIPRDEICHLGEYGRRASNHIHGVDGSGLGLWYCKELAKKHNGNLEIVPEHISDYSFRALLLYRDFKTDDQKCKYLYEKVKEFHEIAQEDFDGTPESNKLPKPMPFSDKEEMGQILEKELEKLKANKELWTGKAEKFDLYCKSREEDPGSWNLGNKNKEMHTSQSASYAFSPFNAAQELMRGTMRFTVTVWFPH